MEEKKESTTLHLTKEEKLELWVKYKGIYANMSHEKVSNSVKFMSQIA